MTARRLFFAGNATAFALGMLTIVTLGALAALIKNRRGVYYLIRDN